MASPQIERLQARMAAIPVAIRADVLPTLEKSGHELAARMKQLAETSRDSGDLIDSIAVTMGGSVTPPYSQPGGSMPVPPLGVAVTVGDSKVRYAHLVEYGTAHAAAQPFFWPAYRLLKKRIANRVKRSIRKSTKENWGKS